MKNVVTELRLGTVYSLEQLGFRIDLLLAAVFLTMVVIYKQRYLVSRFHVRMSCVHSKAFGSIQHLSH